MVLLEPRSLKIYFSLCQLWTFMVLKSHVYFTFLTHRMIDKTLWLPIINFHSKQVYRRYVCGDDLYHLLPCVIPRSGLKSMYILKIGRIRQHRPTTKLFSCVKDAFIIHSRFYVVMGINLGLVRSWDCRAIDMTG